MKKLISAMFFIAILVIGLVACNKNDDKTSTQSKEDDVETQPEGGEGEVSENPISADMFADEILAGNFEEIYNQTSTEFQANVSLKEFESLGTGFIQDAGNFELISEMPLLGMTEYQWMSDAGDKGIRSYWANDLTIEGLQLMPLSSYPDSDAEYTKNTYHMPINEEWFTFWGGTNELLNYHYAVESQRYAYDLIILKGDNSFDGDPADNASYYAFRKDVVAPLGGVVLSVENDIADNTPTIDTNTEEPLGNHVIIKHENNEYSVLAHFKQGSVVVSEGDTIQAGDLLGLAGNSGNSSEAHIHFHVADSANWEEATSIRIKFESNTEPVRGNVTSGF